MSDFRSRFRENPLMHGFTHSVRTLHGTVTGLRVIRGWTGPTGYFLDPTAAYDAHHLRLIGSLTLAKSKVAVIGEDRSPVETMEVIFHGVTGPDALRKQYDDLERLGTDWRKEMVGDGTDPDRVMVAEFLGRVHEQFEKEPPSISLNFTTADWEIGNKEMWSLECFVPVTVLEAIATALEAGRSDALSVSFEVQPSLTSDEYAPPSVAVTVGVLRKGKHDSGQAYGWIKGVSWYARPAEDLPKSDDAKDDPSNALAFAPNPALRGAAPTAVGTAVTATAAIESLARTIKMGFWLLLILISLVAIIR
ncbi:MAG: hypothetical protein JWL61_3708 [Gemmatimonadetes bacterium]|nr:hypothetical protein [Gemmatimonadota bacterium]